MIINSLNKAQNIQRDRVPISYPGPKTLSAVPKRVDLKDFLYHYPVQVNFGSTVKPTAPKEDADFDTTVKKYSRFVPDKWQKDAMASLFIGDDTIMTAPTGTGKTLVAEYVIGKNLAAGQETIYTTPLKALSNEKYLDFCKLYGKENVGLLTGDIKINPKAPVKIMTTEIYRNMLVSSDDETLAKKTKKLATVIYDEAHMMNDRDRGEVWETSVMYTPHHVQQLALSATVHNDTALHAWYDRLLTEKCKAAGVDKVRNVNLIHVSPREMAVPKKYLLYDPNGKKLAPLTVDKYDLAQLKAAATNKAEKPLYEIQKTALQDISKKAKGDGTVEHGLKVLNTILDDFEAPVEHMEAGLEKKLGFNHLEAVRTAAILADPSKTQINPDVYATSDPNAVISAKAPRPSRKSLSGKVNSAEIMKMFEERTLPPQMAEALSKIGGGVTKSGVFRIHEIAKGKDISPKTLRQKLIAAKVNAGLVDQVVSKLSTHSTVAKLPEIELAEVLKREDKLPMITFRFSQRGCDDLLWNAVKSESNFLPKGKEDEVRGIVGKYRKGGVYLGSHEDMAGFLKGVAVHHAGRMPGHKALVEELSQKKLANVIVATDTLGAGINVPVRTVFFPTLSKYAGVDEDGHSKYASLSSNELHQMGGRAGRRNMDLVSYNIFQVDKHNGVEDIFNMVMAPSDNLVSNFKPTYSFLSAFVSKKGKAEDVPALINRSFMRESISSVTGRDDVAEDAVKKFQNMCKVVMKPESGLFQSKDGNFTQTLKGALVSRARGVDSMAFAHVLLKQPGIDKLAPDEMAGLACLLTDGKAAKSAEGHKGKKEKDSKLLQVANSINKLKEDTRARELSEGVDTHVTETDIFGASLVQKWAKVKPDDSGETANEWKKLVGSDLHNGSKMSEGGFFKTVNRAIDVLGQIREAAEFVQENHSRFGTSQETVTRMAKIGEIAHNAVALIKKSPVVDALENAKL